MINVTNYIVFGATVVLQCWFICVWVVFQWCFSRVAVVLQWCFSGVPVVLQLCSSGVSVCHLFIFHFSVVFQWCCSMWCCSMFCFSGAPVVFQ